MLTEMRALSYLENAFLLAMILIR